MIALAGSGSRGCSTIKRLPRKHDSQPPTPKTGGGGAVELLDHAAQLVLDQAKALYRYRPEVEVGDRLFA
jgi:hypothetical protein